MKDFWDIKTQEIDLMAYLEAKTDELTKKKN